MPARRVNMRKIREVLRLLWDCGLSQRQVSACCAVGKTTVSDCASRARRSSLSWAQVQELSDEALESRLYPAGAQRLSTAAQGRRVHAEEESPAAQGGDLVSRARRGTPPITTPPSFSRQPPSRPGCGR
jgi:hypothetical protein